ncbi:MAG: biotin/lipoyl-binding protein [Thermoanaerobacteraceae bacterium]|nr:biotin/lipoyl-binding protein [Thermoanaerobacteraceae bacterium]
MRQFRVTVNGESLVVEVEEIKGGATNPQTRTANAVSMPTQVPRQASSVRGSAASGGPTTGDNITAPMPGNILSIQVKEGEHVKAGQVLLILEAMKMENEIVAPRDGTVKKICVTVGQSVNTGDHLISLE